MTLRTDNIAVIMSIYKNDKLEYIKDAINSICQQENIIPLILIYVDGIIPKQEFEYLECLHKQHIIELIHSEYNRGLSFALNALIDKVLMYPHIEYIARMDSDDISLPRRLEKQKQFMDIHTEIDILGTACEEFGTSYALVEKKLPSQHSELEDFSITRCPFIHPSVMFRRRVFEQGNRYPTHTCFTEDMAFWLELLYKNYKFHNLPDVLLRYRLEENTMTRRAGLSKAKSEVSLRLGYMFLLNKFSLKNMLLIYSRYCFHLLPPKIMSLAYKYLR
ncbi:TPA: glycosyltransferase [Providencia stuartii]|nr:MULTISPECIES: glycosyltransferase [Providencia]EMA3640812.1 glycosyltransferase [Providencia stuartii]EMD1718128.1 glycosyltransferase [Providencia stuartii]MBG5908324.1 glycosyltransferase [Providencia stuartii]MBN5562735.1 glycosyltransferase [Providencia stuartii]MBN5601021.1 glycosyltransferase [Providencia stuartii]